MAIRSHDLKPMTISGYCAWPGPLFNHETCHTDGCTCSCHSAPPTTATPPKKRTRKKLV